MDIINNVLDGVLSSLQVDSYIDQAFTSLKNLSALPKVLTILGVGIVGFMGLWQLIKTLSKLIIVLAVIAGLYLLFQSRLLDQVIG